MKNIKEQFPIFKERKKLIYLDNAATTQKPARVINAILNFYTNSNANINRGMHFLGEEATQLYEQARVTVAKFINSKDIEIIFTRNTTESINLIASSIESIIPQGKTEIVLTEMEHHANLVPWQQLAKRKNLKLIFIKTKEDFSLDYEDAKRKISSNTAIVSVTHKSNVTGIVNEIDKIINLAKKQNALTIIDGAQTIASKKIDVKKLDCDFFAFSGHKIFGPTGIGVLYGKKELLEKMNPYQFGGNMISTASLEKAGWNELPMKFEAGTPNISGSIGLAEAIRWINEFGIENISKNEKELTSYALKKLSELNGIEIYGKNQEGIISFNLKNTHPHDVACLLNDEKICIRAGFHCAMPIAKKLSLNGTCRISFSVYNTKQEIDFLIEQLKKIKGIIK
ncbi:SufS family cysteine desulfurase [Candidatus Pacearchaeota archaeon]|nr:SufS family cysteine desulfurase [Candidatus Pacearchaeota archaeon]